jgi:hypothetical protein
VTASAISLQRTGVYAMSRSTDFLIFVAAATITVLMGDGLYASYRSGVLKNLYGTTRRAKKPASYWVGMCVVAIVFVVLAVGTALMGFMLAHEFLLHP